MIYEISHKYGPTGLQCGFCEGWRVEEGLIALHKPFRPFLLHSVKGTVLCRGAWTGDKRLPEGEYEVRPVQRQPWMDLEIDDLIVAIDLCCECAIELPQGGFCRLTIL